eukprot:12874041-Alexandrium_andersonii.AAC.1
MAVRGAFLYAARASSRFAPAGVFLRMSFGCLFRRRCFSGRVGLCKSQGPVTVAATASSVGRSALARAWQRAPAGPCASSF